MQMSSGLCDIFLEKLEHQVDRCLRLCSLIPPEKVQWAPALPRGIPLSQLLAHLCECLAGFAAVLHAAHPAELARLIELKGLLVRECASVQDATGRIARFRASIREGFAVLQDEDLTTRIPTVFVKSGEAVMSLLLVNLEHLASHKYQLFLYLRVLGVPVESRDLYHFSGE
jgi:hypothetical protein